MCKTSHFDFRECCWSEIASTLLELKEEACSQSVYAYIQANPGIQRHMVEKLIRDLDLIDYVCTDDMLPADMPRTATHH